MLEYKESSVTEVEVSVHGVDGKIIVKFSKHDRGELGEQWCFDVKDYTEMGYVYIHPTDMHYISTVLDKLNAGSWHVSDAGLLCKEVVELHPVKLCWLEQ